MLIVAGAVSPEKFNPGGIVPPTTQEPGWPTPGPLMPKATAVIALPTVAESGLG